MKGDPAVIERTLADYRGNWRLHEEGRLSNLTLRRWMKSYRWDAVAIGALIAVAATAVWSFKFTTRNYHIDWIGTPIMLIIVVVSTIVMPYLFGLIMAIPLIRDKRRYCTTTEYAYYWRANKSLRACAPEHLSTDEFTLIIEKAQRADLKAFRLRCIDRLAESMTDWKTDGKLPTLPEETIFIESLRSTVLSDSDTPIS
ncbi:hypothetical protein KBC99_00250 [Candidatus Saccharibacteria bacterium]|nr:hypothetical protein [Candidatus Saccharibacteria bacterium]